MPALAAPQVKRTKPFLHEDRLLSVQSHVVSGYVGESLDYFQQEALAKLQPPSRKPRCYFPLATLGIRRRRDQHGSI